MNKYNKTISTTIIHLENFKEIPIDCLFEIAINGELKDCGYSGHADPLDLELLVYPCDDTNMSAYRVHKDLQKIGNIADALWRVESETLF